MRRGRSLLVLVLLSSFLVIACSALDVNLVYQFPKWKNGENNISLQYREDGNYHDLKPMGYAVFAHPDSSSALPYAGPVISLGTRENGTGNYVNPDYIYIRPAMERPSSTDRAGVIRIVPPVREGRVEITGEAGMEGSPVPMAIYHGQANFGKPAWSSATPGPFSVNFSFTGSEPIFFAASQPGNNMGFKGYWKGIILSFADASPVTSSGTQPTVSTVTATGTRDTGTEGFTPYVQSMAVIIAALIGSATSLWVATRKKE